MDLTEILVSEVVDRARADRGKGKPGVVTSSEPEELARLRQENRELKMERDGEGRVFRWALS